MSTNRAAGPALRIQIKKGKDSRPTLACIRADGTRTWSTTHAFFPLHDLTHYAVETVLGFDQAFYGLIAAGWNLDSFGEKDRRASMPVDALRAECLVGVLDQERASGAVLELDDVNERWRSALLGLHVAPGRPLTTLELAAIRRRRSELSQQWKAIQPGETLEVAFPGDI